jgi:hypothetical protein
VILKLNGLLGGGKAGSGDKQQKASAHNSYIIRPKIVKRSVFEKHTSHMKLKIVRTALLAIGCVFLATSGGGIIARAQSGTRRTPRSGQSGNAGEFMPAEMTKSSGCKHDGTNPDPQCTPGAVMGISLDTICNTSTRGRRKVTTEMKNQVYAEYGITSHPSGAFEVDHYIPLELGGSNDIANLWPEPAKPAPGFHEKDKVETALHNEVCKAHTMSLEDAQRTVATDWLKYYNDKIKK